MKEIEKLKLTYGSNTAIADCIDAIFTYPLSEIIDYGYSLANLLECVNEAENSLKETFKKCISKNNTYQWRETGDPFELTTDVLQETLNYKGSLSSFKRKIARAKLNELIHYQKLLFNDDTLVDVG